MEEQILKIIKTDSVKTPDGEVTVLWYPEDTAKEITSMVMEFIDFLKDECEIELDLSTGKYVFVNEGAREITFIMTTEEAYEYWYDNIKNKKP